MRAPETDEEWWTHALNIEGLFLERWVEDKVRRSEDWNVVATNLPVAFESELGHQISELDVLAERGGKMVRLTLPIECKKNNPDFIEWLFFSKAYDHPMAALRHDRRDYPANPGTHTIAQSTARLSINAPIVQNARELRGRYSDYKKGDKTKTANEAISSAARQVALAHQALVRGDMSFASGGASSRRMDTRIFLPVIVTTAQISTTVIDPNRVDPETGEIPVGGMKFERRTAVIYEYPLPPQLQFSRALVGADGEIAEGNRLDIVVVHSANFPEFLNDLSFGLQMKTLIVQSG